MAKFTLERDNKMPLFITVDQISERHVGPEYIPPPTKVIITRLKTAIDPKTQKISYIQSYAGGENKAGDSHVTTPFMEGLDKGIYLAFYQPDFRKSAEVEKKLVFSIYCDEPVSSL